VRTRVLPFTSRPSSPLPAPPQRAERARWLGAPLRLPVRRLHDHGSHICKVLCLLVKRTGGRPDERPEELRHAAPTSGRYLGRHHFGYRAPCDGRDGDGMWLRESQGRAQHEHHLRQSPAQQADAPAGRGVAGQGRAEPRFVVGIENGDGYSERNVKVTLLIKQKPQPIRKSLTIG